LAQISGSGDHRVVPYDPTWPARAAHLIRLIQQTLGDTAVRVDHVGSTAVPGLAGRPIPDIQVSVRDILGRTAFTRQLERAGYRHFVFPELPVDDYLVFVPQDGSNTEHIEVCEVGSYQETRHLAVRDYLRTHPDERKSYEAVKRAAADAACGAREVYSAGKHEFLQALEQRAVDWYRQHEPSP
jgi:GrpB-like predicted nucleotidyltransferase (UPF0157 family)